MIEFPITLTSGGSVCLPGHAFALALGYTKNRGVYRLHVDATGEWEGLAIRAFWHVPDGKDPASSLVVDGYVDVPASVTAQPGNGCITFEGSDGTKTVTSADLRYRVSANSGTEDGTEPEPGTPAWQQLVDAVHTDATAAEQAKTDAQTAASEAATSAGSASQSAIHAAGSLQELKDGIASGDFKGEKGDKGDTGPQGPKGETGPAVALDTTLTHEGEAADAKATGDAISAVKARQNVLAGTETGNPLSVDDAFPAPLCGLTVYGRSTQNGTPTPDAPVPIISAGDSGSVTVKVTGKNLLDSSQFQNPSLTEVLTVEVTLSANTSYTLSTNAPRHNDGANLFFMLPGEAINTVENGVWQGHKKSITTNSTGKAQIKYRNYGGTISDYSAYWFQLELGTAATAYSPYREQLLTLPTPNGLPGIPVTSGGTYTDPQGQQWVCDEVDLEKGVKVQRVGKAEIKRVDVSKDPKWYDANKSYSYEVTLFTSFFLNNAAFQAAEPCNRFIMKTFNSFYNHGIETGGLSNQNYAVFNISKTLGICTTPEEFKAWFNENAVLYKILATPIETPLTPDEIAAYKALTTYGPDTVVQASDGAGIKLDYQRDVNLVVKNLEDAIASMTTT